jgi:hypothetical protein
MVSMLSCRVEGVRRAGFLAGCCLSLALAGGCAGLSPEDVTRKATTPEEIVAERAQERCDALVAGNVEKAYSFLSPASRQVMSLTSYASSVRVGFWKKAKVERVECREADLCDVHLVVEYIRGSAIATPLRESWAKSDGQWWYVQK